MIDLVYCASGNRALAQQAIESGWLYGSQPHTIYFPIQFSDLDFKKMDSPKYLDKYKEFIAKERPKLAVVPDIFNRDDLPNAIEFAHRITKFVQTIIIVPKISGIIQDIPAEIDNVTIRLGYSVKTKYGGTGVPLWEFKDWKDGVHLLGGSPHAQLELAHYMPVESVDCNYHQRVSFLGKWWSIKTGLFVQNDTRSKRAEEWFRISCENIKEAWERFG